MTYNLPSSYSRAEVTMRTGRKLDNEESSQEELQLVGLLHQKDCIIQELKNNLKAENCVFAERVKGHSRDDLVLPDSSVDMIEELPRDENQPAASQANPDYQVLQAKQQPHNLFRCVHLV